MKKVKRVIALAIMSVMLMGTVLTAQAATYDCHHGTIRGFSVGWCTSGCGGYAYLYDCVTCGNVYVKCDRGHFQ